MAGCESPRHVLQKFSDGLMAAFKDGQDGGAWKGLIRILEKGPNWMHDDGIMDLPRVASCACRFAAFNLRGKGPLKFDEEVFQIEQSLANMSFKEQEEIFETHLEKNIEDEKGRYKGRMMSMKKLFDRTKADQEFRDRGGGRDTMNDVEENQARIEELNVVERNPGAKSMILSPEMAEGLPLTRISGGVVKKGFWGGKQFAFGLFADTENIKKVLGKKWANREPQEVLKDSAFYHDIICSSPDLGLTVLVMPSKRLSLYQMQREYKKRISMTMEELNASKKDMEDLDNLVGMFDGNKLRGMVPWASGTRILPNTMIYFDCGGDEGLKVEVTNPGHLAEQYTTELGTVNNPKLTYAVLCEVLGNRAIDKLAREETANNVLYYANGFTTNSNPDNINQISLEGEPSFTVHNEKITPQTFLFNRAREGKLLLKGKKMYHTEFVESPVHELEAKLVSSS